MTLEEFNDLYNKIMAEHSWKNNLSKRTFITKYINFSLDTRDGSIWSVTFHGGWRFDRKRWAKFIFTDVGTRESLYFREDQEKPLIEQLKEFFDDCDAYNRKKSKENNE